MEDEGLKAFQREHSLGGVSVRELFEEGRSVLMPFVLDRSAAMAGVFPDEATEVGEVLRDLPRGRRATSGRTIKKGPRGGRGLTPGPLFGGWIVPGARGARGNRGGAATRR